MKKVLKLILAIVLTLATAASSLVWVGAVAYEDGDIILNESMINSDTKAMKYIRDRINTSEISWNEETGRLHVKASGQGAIEIANYLPTENDAFTVSADFYIKGGVGTSTTQGRLGLGIYSDIGTNANGWTHGLYSWIGMDSGWGDSKSAVQYNEKNGATTLAWSNTSDYLKNPGYTGTDIKNYAQCISFKLVVDPTADNTVSAYFNGKLVSTVSSDITAADAKGNVFIFVRNTEFEVDNLKLVAGNGTESSYAVYDVEKGAYDDGAAVIDENIIAAMAGADGNTDAIFGTNSSVKWDGNKLVFNDSTNSIKKLNLFPSDLDEYTVSVDFSIQDLGNATSALVQLGISEYSIWGSGVVVQFNKSASSNDAKVYFSNKRTVASSSGSVLSAVGYNSNQAYNGGTYTFGADEYINVTVKVDANNVTINVSSLKAGVSPLNTVTIPRNRLGSDLDAPFLAIRGGTTVYFDNFKVYAGTGNEAANDMRVGCDGNIAYYGHQRTTAAGSTYGLRFVSQVNSTDNYSAIGFKVSVTSSADGNVSVIKSFDKNGSTVYKKVNGQANGVNTSYTPESGYTALAAFTVTDIPATAGVTYTFTITPYAIDKDGDTIFYTPYEVQYDGTAEPVDRAN